MNPGGSIRSKIWRCVLVALAGYFIATLSSFYSNMTQYDRLSHLGEVHFPMAALGSDLLHTFKKQTERYEDAFLTGENDLAGQGNELSATLTEQLDQLQNAVNLSPHQPISAERIEKLKQDYNAYAQVAAEVYTSVAEVEFSIALQKKVQQLGRMQRSLFEQFTDLDEKMTSSFVAEIEKNKAKSLYSTFFLCGLFILVLLAVTLIVDRVANRLLVSPLTNIQDNVQRFSHSQEVIKPDVIHSTDEIGQLARAFWEMTENLKTTTVSKKYVDNVIRNMSGGLVVIRPDGNIQTVNQRTLEMFGYCEEELLGKPATIFFAPNNEPLLCPSRIDKLMKDGTVKDLETLCCTKSGRLFPSHFSGSAMHNEQNVLEGIICVFNDITELKNAELNLKRMAHYDALTGLANRNLFFERLESAIAEAKRDDRIFALLYLDLDNFKPINDTLGHDIGDQVLQTVAERLHELVRAGDTVARMGGDEFTVILSALLTPQDAEMIARKIVKEISRPIPLDGSSHTLGVSIGISIFPENGTHIESLVTKADHAMYAAKESGRNTYCRYTEGTKSQFSLPGLHDTPKG